MAERLFGVGFLPVSDADACKVLAYTGTNTTLNTFSSIAANTTVAFSSEAFDIGSGFNTSTYTFTCPSEGYYFVSAQIKMSTAKKVTLEIIKGSTVIAQQSSAATAENCVNVFTVVSCIKGETIHIGLTNDDTASAILAAGQDDCRFIVFKLA